jgi:serine/threonine protein kinase
MALEPDTRLGPYRIVDLLGVGGMGEVYRARDERLNRLVAVKVLPADRIGANAERRSRFIQEAQLASALQHPNIVTIFDAGEEHDLAYIAMEFLRGKDLVEHTRADHLLPVDKVVSIAARVAEALDYAHRHHVVHRDIKPANIMYEPASDTVKVTDFGIARVTDASKTKTGMVLGTPSFMSPEQLAGKKVDGRADLYSLGVMLFQLLTGVLPFKGDSMAALMFKIANEAPPDVRELRPELPPVLAEVVGRALAKSPEQRFPSGNTFALALRASLDGAATAVVAPAPVAAPANGHNAEASADRQAEPPAAADPFQRTTVLDPQNTIPRHS